MDVQQYSFAVDLFTIHDTRSRHEDTDYISASVAVAGRPTLKASQKLGDLNNGTFRTAMNFRACRSRITRQRSSATRSSTAVIPIRLPPRRRWSRPFPPWPKRALRQPRPQPAGRSAQRSGHRSGRRGCPYRRHRPGRTRGLGGVLSGQASLCQLRRCGRCGGAYIHRCAASCRNQSRTASRSKRSPPRDRFRAWLRRQFQLRRVLVGPLVVILEQVEQRLARTLMLVVKGQDKLSPGLIRSSPAMTVTNPVCCPARLATEPRGPSLRPI